MIEERLVSSLSHYLTQFKQKSKQLWTFRCPVCGDSKKSKIKTRGYIYNHKSRYWYKCFNCDLSLPLERFCKEYYPEVYCRHIVDSFIQQDSTKDNFEEELKQTVLPIQITKEVGMLPASTNFEALQFLKSRKIPEEFYSEILFIEDVNSLLNLYTPLGYKPLAYKSSRLVIPILTESSNLVGYVTRSIKKDDPIRYYNIKVTNELFVWGQQRIDVNKPVYVVEGVFDAMFIPNAVATLSATKFPYTVSWCKGKGAKTVIIVLDNEPRNKQIRELLSRFIKEGEQVVLLTGYPKDINDIVLQFPQIDIIKLLQERTTSRLSAQLDFLHWQNQ